MNISISLLVNFFGRNSRSGWGRYNAAIRSGGSSYFFTISALGSLSKFETVNFSLSDYIMRQSVKLNV
jgi:hypothetical protein